MDEIRQTLQRRDKAEIRALFGFDSSNSEEQVLFKFRLWGAYFFPKFFKSEDAWFHYEIDRYNYRVYRGLIRSFTDIAFRGAAKTTRTKLWRAFVVANDLDHSRRYMKILSEDLGNSKQSVTDIYNMLIDTQVLHFYPEIFERTEHKREETMGSFTTSTGVKLKAGSVGQDQRGDLQEEARPDDIWFDDFETRNTLRSAVKTQAIWDNMQEAIDGLAKGGSFVATCNYLSERGNVHKLVEGADERNIVLIVPLLNEAGESNWEARYSKIEAQQLLEDAEYPEEYNQNPSASKDVLFSREHVDKQEKLKPWKEISGFKMYRQYNPSHRYASGHDVAGGIGLDSSTSVFIDFDTIPAQVVATYHNNEIREDDFGDEVARQGQRYGECLVAVEKNNHGHATLGRLKQIYDLEKIYKTERKETTVEAKKRVEYGWDTNSLTKSKMMAKLSKAVEDGHIALNDPGLIKEARSYTRNDLMDAEVDPRLTTRHFDLLIACAIAWQMKDYATVAKPKDDTSSEYQPDAPLYGSIGV